MLFFLCILLTLWLFIWVSKAAEIQLTTQQQAKALEELAATMEELNRKMEKLLYKDNVSRETNRN